MRSFDPARNTGGEFGDDGGEMLRRDRLDERTADAVLTGRRGQPEGDDLADLAAFVAAVRSEATMAAARPNATLAEVLAHGVSAQKGDLPVTAASNVNGPATQVSGPPKWRIRRMLEIIATKLAALGLAGKAGIAGATVLAATTGAGAAGVLPDTLQDRVADAVSAVTPFEFPTSADDEAEFGGEVAEDATDPDDPGVEGEDIADDASDGRSTEGGERAEEGRSNADRSSEEVEDLPEQDDVELPDEADQRGDASGADTADTAPAGAGQETDERGQSERP